MNTLRIRRIVPIILFGCLLILCCAPLAYNLRPPTNAAPNSVRRLAETYGVSDQEVLRISHELEVDSNSLGGYGRADFPYNYFRYRLEQIETQQGAVMKSDVEAVVQGYEVKCELYPENIVYLFYSDRLTPRIFGRPAMMLDFYFNSDFTLRYFNQPNLADSGYEWQKELIREKCLE